MYTLLLILGIAAILFWLVGSVLYFRKQQTKPLDKGADLNGVRHPITSNPIIIVYIAAPIVAIAGAIIWMSITHR